MTAPRTVFRYVDAQGRQQTAARPEDVPGQAGYISSALTNGGTRTADGDVFNPFRGYRDALGGSFGDPNAPRPTPAPSAPPTTGAPMPGEPTPQVQPPSLPNNWRQVDQTDPAMLARIRGILTPDFLASGRSIEDALAASDPALREFWRSNNLQVGGGQRQGEGANEILRHVPGLGYFNADAPLYEFTDELGQRRRVGGSGVDRVGGFDRQADIFGRMNAALQASGAVYQGGGSWVGGMAPGALRRQMETLRPLVPQVRTRSHALSPSTPSSTGPRSMNPFDAFGASPDRLTLDPIPLPPPVPSPLDPRYRDPNYEWNGRAFVPIGGGTPPAGGGGATSTGVRPDAPDGMFGGSAAPTAPGMGGGMGGPGRRGFGGFARQAFRGLATANRRFRPLGMMGPMGGAAPAMGALSGALGQPRRPSF